MEMDERPTVAAASSSLLFTVARELLTMANTALSWIEVTTSSSMSGRSNRMLSPDQYHRRKYCWRLLVRQKHLMQLPGIGISSIIFCRGSTRAMEGLITNSAIGFCIMAVKMLKITNLTTRYASCNRSPTTCDSTRGIGRHRRHIYSKNYCRSIEKALYQKLALPRGYPWPVLWRCTRLCASTSWAYPGPYNRLCMCWHCHTWWPPWPGLCHRGDLPAQRPCAAGPTSYTIRAEKIYRDYKSWDI